MGLEFAMAPRRIIKASQHSRPKSELASISEFALDNPLLFNGKAHIYEIVSRMGRHSAFRDCHFVYRYGTNFKGCIKFQVAFTVTI